LVETLVRGARTKSPLVRCKDGDDSCDFDASRGSCTFAVAFCLNEPGCSAAGVTKIVARGPAAGAALEAVARLATSRRVGNAMQFAGPFTTSCDCTDLVPVLVRLR